MQEQTSLFDSVVDDIDIVDGSLKYYPQYLDGNEASLLYEILKEQIAWQQSEINIYGKRVKIPRLNAWYGDENCPYEYSGHYFHPKPWLPCLYDIKCRIEALTGASFNSVLVNYYRDGNDGVAWHSDDEPELGRNPVVASLSLGEQRSFHLKHRYNKTLAVRKLELSHGSLLLMGGELQHYWSHQLPKTTMACAGRINLTYRYVFPEIE
jgi:alkylated DNA repair dioxygenase AlkB